LSGPLGDERPRDWLSRLDDFERDRSVAIHGPAVVRAERKKRKGKRKKRVNSVNKIVIRKRK
jgi:hypothetical protein